MPRPWRTTRPSRSGCSNASGRMGRSPRPTSSARAAGRRTGSGCPERGALGPRGVHRRRRDRARAARRQRPLLRRHRAAAPGQAARAGRARARAAPAQAALPPPRPRPARRRRRRRHVRAHRQPGCPQGAALHTELVELGSLVPVEVEGMRGKRFVVAEEVAQMEAPPEPPLSVAFIAPFDSLLWDTALLASLFDFAFVWEGFFKAEKRRWGYYVLPILFGDRLVGRIEPRIDREASRVEVLGLWWEEGFAPRRADGFVEAMRDALSAYLRFAVPTASRGRRTWRPRGDYSRHELAEGEGRGLSPAARRGLLRDAEPVGRRQRASPSSRSASRRWRRRAPASPGRWAARTTASRATRRSSIFVDRGRRDTSRSTPTSRAASRSIRTASAANVKLAAATGDRRAVDRGLDGRSRRAALRLRPRRRAGSRRATGDRRERHGRRSHRPLRGVRRRAARISTRRSAGCRPTPRPAPTASTRRASRRREQVAAVVAAVAPKPVNLLINAPFITVAEAADLGVRRISVGGTLARTAWAGFLAAAQEIATRARSPDSSTCRTSTRSLAASGVPSTHGLLWSGTPSVNVLRMSSSAITARADYRRMSSRQRLETALRARNAVQLRSALNELPGAAGRWADPEAMREALRSPARAVRNAAILAGTAVVWVVWSIGMLWRSSPGWPRTARASPLSPLFPLLWFGASWLLWSGSKRRRSRR